MIRDVMRSILVVIISVVLVGCGGGDLQATIDQQQQEIDRLKAENQELEKLRQENQEVQRLRKENLELAKLRGQYQELTRLKKENEQMRGQPAKGK